MPQPALWDDAASGESGAALSLADAAARFEAALSRLEALVEAGPLQSERFRRNPAKDGGAHTSALEAELAAAREREQAMEAAAAAASQALGRAMVEVRQALTETPSDEAATDPAEGPGPAGALDPARGMGDVGE